MNDAPQSDAGSVGAKHGQLVGQRDPRRSAWIILGAFCGAFVVLLGLLIYWIVSVRDNTPLLTRAEFEQAAERWRQSAPASYTLDVQMAGERPGPVHVEVREGQVRHMTRDGVEPRQPRTWEFWTVDGMLDTIDQELEMAIDPPKSFRAPAGSESILRAQFDPRYGYPARFHRILLRPGQATLEVEWRVKNFMVDE